MNVIGCGDYRGLCPMVFDQDGITEPPPSGLLFCPMDRIHELFWLITKSRTKNKYILVSSRSDFGLAYQDEYPPWADMVRWIPFITSGPDIRQLGYKPLIVPPRMAPGRCKESDQYSSRCYSYTNATFDDIPENIVHWFCTNANVTDSRVTALPFGVQERSDYKMLTEHYKPPGEKAFSGIYFNFQNNTNERLDATHFARKLPNAQLVTSPLPYEQYLKHLSESLFVFCPEGNGYDSYRIWETLYVGSIPIVIANRWNEQFQKLPILFISSLNDLNSVSGKHAEIIAKDCSNDMLDFNHWRSRILSAAQALDAGGQAEVIR
jgi:hypothetical protein